MSNLNVDLDFSNLATLDQDDLLQRRNGMEELLNILRGDTRSYTSAESFLDATEAELVRRAAEGSYKPTRRKGRPAGRPSARR
jgi:hypothetical protein